MPVKRWTFCGKHMNLSLKLYLQWWQYTGAASVKRCHPRAVGRMPLFQQLAQTWHLNVYLVNHMLRPWKEMYCTQSLETAKKLVYLLAWLFFSFEYGSLWKTTPISPPLALPNILVLQGYRISPGRVTALGYPEDAMRSKIDHLFAPQQAYKTSE